MAKMVDGFLNLSVLHSGNIQVEAQRTELNALLEEIVRWLGLVAERKGVCIILQPTACPVHVAIDPAKIKQVILNLITNALEHGPEGQTVEVRVVVVDEQVVVEVEDQGRGVSQEAQDKIFEAFVRGPEGKTRGESGCGLGLYISNLIVTAHGGSLAVRSEVGRGTVFAVTLPLPTTPPPASSQVGKVGR